MAYEPKTKPGGDVDVFIETVEHPVRRADAKVLRALMEEVSGQPATMWGPSIIGFGAYDYTYPSGHSGTAPRIGFSPRKAQTVLYLLDGVETYDALLARLGKVKTGKACLYIGPLEKLDIEAVRELTAASWAEMARRHPAK